MAADAREVVRAGANEIHLHVRDADGHEALDTTSVAETIVKVRKAVPGTLIGISTGEWIEGTDEGTLAAIRDWTELPDYASVNLGEPKALDIMRLLSARGVGIEAGVASQRDAERLVDEGVAPLALRILIEISQQTESEANAVTDAVLASLEEGGVRKPILLHGFDATVWPLVQRGISAGYSVRLGLEDGDALPDGRKATGNSDLIAAAVALKERLFLS
jgi:uncharacterized protein (DUF849 family)